MSGDNLMTKCKPFVKWAGGKRQILEKLLESAPDKFNKYYEPFIGGGALFFELCPKSAVINDYNSELMNVYMVLLNKDKFNNLCNTLDEFEKKHDENFYYSIRNLDRNKVTFETMPDYYRAARTIYMNKAGFNGLYRVNAKNEFNVPFGKKVKLNTYERDNLKNIHDYLSSIDIEILSEDFESSVKSANRNDFIYFDPPYDTDKDGFIGYTQNGFGKDEQRRLAEVYKKLAAKGCYVMLSNHNTDLIQELYAAFNIRVITARRNINSVGTKRGPVEEVIITNY